MLSQHEPVPTREIGNGSVLEKVSADHPSNVSQQFDERLDSWRRRPKGKRNLKPAKRHLRSPRVCLEAPRLKRPNLG